MPVPRFVVDANVAIYGLVPDALLTAENVTPATASACLRFLERAVALGAELHVPYLFASEVANVIGGRIYAGQLTSEGVTNLVEGIFTLPWRPSIPDWGRVFQATRDLQRKTSGDSEYLALAQTRRCELVTADGTLVRAVQGRKLTVTVAHVASHPLAQP